MDLDQEETSDWAGHMARLMNIQSGTLTLQSEETERLPAGDVQGWEDQTPHERLLDAINC